MDAPCFRDVLMVDAPAGWFQMIPEISVQVVPAESEERGLSGRMEGRGFLL